ncbi:MAG: hypothetical protein WBH09_04365, partial [Rugosibacter sp.]
GDFPLGDLIGAQFRRWKSTDIAAWLNEKAKEDSLREAELFTTLRRKSVNRMQLSPRNTSYGRRLIMQPLNVKTPPL